MNIKDITQEVLLKNENIRSVDFEHEWYFVKQDLARVYMGAFEHIEGLPLPILVNNKRNLMKCISYSDIENYAKSVSSLSEFEVNIKTALNFNPKKK